MRGEYGRYVEQRLKEGVEVWWIQGRWIGDVKYITRCHDIGDERVMITSLHSSPTYPVFIPMFPARNHTTNHRSCIHILQTKTPIPASK
jgi:hypothetical protein